jgi:hypothetical protein
MFINPLTVSYKSVDMFINPLHTKFHIPVVRIWGSICCKQIGSNILGPKEQRNTWAIHSPVVLDLL